MFVTFPLLFEGGVARTDVNCLIISFYRAGVVDWISDLALPSSLRSVRILDFGFVNGPP